MHINLMKQKLMLKLGENAKNRAINTEWKEVFKEKALH